MTWVYLNETTLRRGTPKLGRLVELRKGFLTNSQ